jgi:hypothetical protein
VPSCKIDKEASAKNGFQVIAPFAKRGYARSDDFIRTGPQPNRMSCEQGRIEFVGSPTSAWVLIFLNKLQVAAIVQDTLCEG